MPDDYQLQARELVATYEGAHSMECEHDDRGNLHLLTDTGKRWSISPNGEECIRDDGFASDLAELDQRVNHPIDFADRCDPTDAVAPRELRAIAPVTDHDIARADDFDAEDFWDRSDEAWEQQMGVWA